MKMTKAQQERQERLRAKGKVEAKQKIVERGILQFRADEQTIRAVLNAAEKEKIPVGTLLKKWIREKLEERHTNASVTALNADVLSRLETLESNVNRLTQKIDGARNEK